MKMLKNNINVIADLFINQQLLVIIEFYIIHIFFTRPV